jgi:hypothetical protein
MSGQKKHSPIFIDRWFEGVLEAKTNPVGRDLSRSATVAPV